MDSHQKETPRNPSIKEPGATRSMAEYGSPEVQSARKCAVVIAICILLGGGAASEVAFDSLQEPLSPPTVEEAEEYTKSSNTTASLEMRKKMKRYQCGCMEEGDYWEEVDILAREILEGLFLDEALGRRYGMFQDFQDPPFIEFVSMSGWKAALTMAITSMP
ncbi:hypothetical protein COCOBI_11-1050 [Coccomyxa sp. Obi]|nr:hypothetical protein COCOBI_11-1050 [Coccomyxa sp. Obi]